MMRRWANWWTEQGLHEQTRLRRLRRIAIQVGDYPRQAEADWFAREARKIRYLELCR